MPALAMLHQIAGRELSADPSDFCRVPAIDYAQCRNEDHVG